MATMIEMIKELRRLTGAGVLDCKKVLEETSGELERAVEVLRQKGLAAAAEKADRTVTDGRIEAYVHFGNKLGALIEVNCETDFVARTEEFASVVHDLAMQVAATDPRWVSRHDVPAEVTEGEKSEYLSDIDEGKPEHIVERIIEGKLAKFYQSNCLLDQDFIKDETKTIQQVLTEAIARLGENIVIKRFSRFQIG